MNNTHFFIKNNFVHLWRAFLPTFIDKEQDLLSLLSEDEVNRAKRFKFPLHQQRFIIARGLLRKILSLYTNIPAKDIRFIYGERGKPYISDNRLQFNVSHSHDMAVYALTGPAEIGIDIEKIEPEFKNSVAKRFFSEQEYQQLMDLPENKRTKAFYRIWARKEAIIKLIGQGLYVPLNNFSISSANQAESVSFVYQEKEYHYYFQSFQANPAYEAAFATESRAEKIIYWQWSASLVPEDGWVEA